MKNTTYSVTIKIKNVQISLPIKLICLNRSETKCYAYKTNLLMAETATILRDNVTEILNLWQVEVQKKVPAAMSTNTIALHDHLPKIIEDIADILERLEDVKDITADEKYRDLVESSKHHGRHRAATANYTVEQVVHEYMIFHRILIMYLKANSTYTDDVADVLKCIIETSILKAVSAFSRSIQEMQEKLIGTLAHDIRNPLSAAQISLEMVALDETPEWRNQMLGAADRSVRKATGLVEGLMHGITVRAGEGMMLDFAEHNIIDDIQWVCEDAREVYASTITLECSSKDITGIFDSTAIRRLLENLIGNAVKYGSHKHPITFTVLDHKDRVVMSIHNHGTPIPREKQLHIFDFLGRERNGLDTVRQSWGMGLTLAQIVAEAHGGDIKLQSDAATGTLFTVTLLKRFNTPGKIRTKLTFVEANN